MVGLAIEIVSFFVCVFGGIMLLCLAGGLLFGSVFGFFHLGERMCKWLSGLWVVPTKAYPVKKKKKRVVQTGDGSGSDVMTWFN